VKTYPAVYYYVIEQMPDELHNQTAKFNQSFLLLSKFLDEWIDRVKSQAIQDDIRKAAWFVWGRYILSIRTIHKICNPYFLPDIWLIARSCLEHEATLRGIMGDPKIAKDYLNFMNKAKAYYAWLLEKLGLSDQLADLEPDLIKTFGKNWRNEKAATWSKASELVEKYGGEASRRCYALFSHFTHCSVVASQMLEHTTPSQARLDNIIASVYGGYILVTSDFLDFIWGPIVTTDSKRCKKDFLNVMRKWI
jgi:hypothetical protein